MNACRVRISGFSVGSLRGLGGVGGTGQWTMDKRWQEVIYIVYGKGMGRGGGMIERSRVRRGG